MIIRKIKSNSELVEKLNMPAIYSEKTNIPRISPDTTDKSPHLLLKIIEGQLLIGTVISINAAGIVGGKRKDGSTYFWQCSEVIM